MSLIAKFEDAGSPYQAAPGGAIPRGPLTDGNVLPINNTFSQGQYYNNLPSDIDTAEELARAQDTTG